MIGHDESVRQLEVSKDKVGVVSKNVATDAGSIRIGHEWCVRELLNLDELTH
jgi:hypothetical protein